MRLHSYCCHYIELLHQYEAKKSPSKSKVHICVQQIICHMWALSTCTCSVMPKSLPNTYVYQRIWDLPNTYVYQRIWDPYNMNHCLKWRMWNHAKQSLSTQCILQLASFLGPAQLPVACSTESDGKLGGPENEAILQQHFCHKGHLSSIYSAWQLYTVIDKNYVID